MKNKEHILACVDGFKKKKNRLIPFKRYTSIRKFKKANPWPYSKHGWSVWDEIMAQKDANKEMAECHYDYGELYEMECWETI